MKIIPRALVMLSALASIIVALGLWFGMENLLPGMGIATTDLADGLVGRATVRADMAGLFGGIGICAALGAIRQSRHWTNSALVLVSVAITGRFIGLATDGAASAVIQPVMVEAATIGLLLWLRATQAEKA